MRKLSECTVAERRAVAGRANLSPALVDHLAGDRDAGVRMRIAGRAGLPDRLVDLLAEDTDGAVRRCIAERVPDPRFLNGEWWV